MTEEIMTNSSHSSFGLVHFFLHPRFPQSGKVPGRRLFPHGRWPAQQRSSHTSILCRRISAEEESVACQINLGSLVSFVIARSAPPQAGIGSPFFSFLPSKGHRQAGNTSALFVEDHVPKWPECIPRARASCESPQPCRQRAVQLLTQHPFFSLLPPPDGFGVPARKSSVLGSASLSFLVVVENCTYGVRFFSFPFPSPSPAQPMAGLTVLPRMSHFPLAVSVLVARSRGRARVLSLPYRAFLSSDFSAWPEVVPPLVPWSRLRTRFDSRCRCGSRAHDLADPFPPSTIHSGRSRYESKVC